MEKDTKKFRKILSVVCNVSAVLALVFWSFAMLSTYIQYDENDFRATHPEYVEYLEATEPYPWLESEQQKYKYYFLTEEEQAAEDKSGYMELAGYLVFMSVALFSGFYIAKRKKEEEKELKATETV